MDTRFQFIPMKSEHVRAAAALRVAFRDFGYLSKMSVNFWEFFLSKAIELPEVIAQVAIDVEEKKLVGYIVGAVDATAIKKSLMRWPSVLIVGWHALKMFMTHPGQVIVIGKVLLRREKQSISIPPQRWITWIVDDACKKNGIGLTLYQHLCTRMHAAGVLAFYGPVDCDNDVSNMAHIKFGAEKIGTLIIEGRRHYLWKHDSAKWLCKSK